MPARKSLSNGRSEAGMRNGMLNGDKGTVVAGTRANHSASDSDDDDVMRQLLTSARRVPRARTNTNRSRVASRRDIGSDGPGSDSDNRGSAMSEDDDIQHRRRRAGTESPATTPMGSPSQTPGMTSSSEGGPRRADGMDVDSGGIRSVRNASGDRPGRGPDARPNEARALNSGAQETNTPIGYIPCHTWPPCAVCARIAGLPPPTTATSSFMLARQRSLAAARDAPRSAPLPQLPLRQPSPLLADPPSASNHVSQPSLRLPPARLDDRWNSDFIPPPMSPPPAPIDPPRSRQTVPGLPPPLPSNAQHPVVPRPTHPANPYNPWPMEPLYVSAGVAPAHSRSISFTPSAPSAQQTALPHIIRPVTLQSLANPRAFMSSKQPRSSQASSSTTPLLNGQQVMQTNGELPKTRGRGKRGTKKARAKRYNRKKREEWPPEGWNPIWEEERPRKWEGYEIPDEIAPDRVYEHLRRRFDLKSMGHCKWEGCVPTEASKDGYKMLKRHVETVHLGLKLVCKLCGVRKRADNRRKATHKRGCPEREDGSIAMPTGTTTVHPSGSQDNGDGPNENKNDGNVQGSGPMEEDELMEDGSGGDEYDDGEDGDEMEEDELEEDELEEDQLDEDQGGPIQDQHRESEYESEDD